MPPSQPRKPDVSAAAKERNEYIPSFISKKPFYAVDDTGEDHDYLEHQRLQKQEQDSKWYDRGKKLGPAATKFRKGACENCGAMTHKKKDCLSRPRKQGAKYTGKNIEADEVVQDMQLGWDAKRDRWNGYDATDFNERVEEYNELEEMRRKARDAEKAAKESAEQNSTDAVADSTTEEPAVNGDATEAEAGEEEDGKKGRFIVFVGRSNSNSDYPRILHLIH